MSDKTIPQNNDPLFAQKHFRLYVFLGILSLYLITRMTHLTALPIFNDEAVYLRWAKMIQEDLSNLLISIQADNKKPLQIWLLAVSLQIFPDPLWAGRFISVLAGLFSLMGIYLVGCRLHSARLGIFAGLLYVISPYHLFFDRMVHEVSLLNVFFIWMIWLTLSVFQKETRIHPFYYWLLALVAGFSLLTLSTAILFVFLPLLFKIIFFKEKGSPPWGPILCSCLAGIVIGGFPYGVLYFTVENFSVKNYFIPTGHGMSGKNIFDLLLGMPSAIFHGFKGFLAYFTVYLTWPIFLLAVFSLALQFKNFNKKYFILQTYFFIPAFILLGAAGTGFSRYYLFCATPLLLWAALTLTWLWDVLNERLSSKSFYAVLTVLPFALFSPAAMFDYKLMTQPEKAPFIEYDRYQYVGSQFSGYGVPEAIAFFRETAADKKITILTTFNWGNPADAIYVYLSDHPNIRIHMAYWMFEHPLLPPERETISLYQPYTGKFLGEIKTGDLDEVYFIRRTSPGFKRDLFVRANRNFPMIRAFGKPDSVFFVEIYKLRGN